MEATELHRAPRSPLPLWPALRFAYVHLPWLGRLLGGTAPRLPKRWREILVGQVSRGVLAAWHDHDVKTLLAVYDRDAVIEMSNWTDWLDRSIYRGADGVRQFFADFDAAWRDFSFQPTRQLELTPERYLVEIEFEGTGASSGIPVRRRFFQVGQVRNGRFTVMANYTDEGEAFGAAGLGDEAISPVNRR